MKFSASIAFIVLVGLVACSSALPARKRMVYYQQPAQYYAQPQRIMYMQYVQPGRTHARSTQAASALVAGETVATGTYLKESDLAAAGPGAEDITAESQQHDEDVLSAAGAHVATSVAEAYPEEVVPEVEVELENTETEVAAAGAVYDDAAKVPRDYNFETPAVAVDVASSAEQVPVETPVETPAVEAELPVPAPIAPVAVPANRYLPAHHNKKVIVELEQSAEADQEEANIAEDEEAEAVADDVEAEDEEVVPVAPPARIPNARRPIAKKPVKAAGANKPSKPAQPLPAGTFFPIDFGGTAGGAIAIANSFSTGEGGAATSHAIAYGSPEAARARVRPSQKKFH